MASYKLSYSEGIDNFLVAVGAKYKKDNLNDHFLDGVPHKLYHIKVKVTAKWKTWEWTKWKRHTRTATYDMVDVYEFRYRVSNQKILSKKSVSYVGQNGSFYDDWLEDKLGGSVQTLG